MRKVVHMHRAEDDLDKYTGTLAYECILFCGFGRIFTAFACWRPHGVAKNLKIKPVRLNLAHHGCHQPLTHYPM